MMASPPAPGCTSAMSTSAAATSTWPTLASMARRQTCTIIGTPQISASGFPGKPRRRHAGWNDDDGILVFYHGVSAGAANWCDCSYTYCERQGKALVSRPTRQEGLIFMNSWNSTRLQARCWARPSSCSASSELSGSFITRKRRAKSRASPLKWPKPLKPGRRGGSRRRGSPAVNRGTLLASADATKGTPTPRPVPPATISPRAAPTRSAPNPVGSGGPPHRRA